MTADQLIKELFENHWIITTLFLPHVTFIYAWVTDQTLWWFGSFMVFVTWAVIGAVIS